MKSRPLANIGLALASAAVAFGLSELGVRFWVPVRNVGPSFTAFDPVYGKRLKRDFRATRYTPEFTMSFTTNSMGFRGPELASPPQRPLLFLGDSYTMGYGVNDGQEFPARVGQALAARGVLIPVINGGVGDDGNGRWVKFLRNEGSRLNPRLVILQLSNNDFGDNVRERLFSVSASGALIENPVPGPGWPRMLQQVIEAIPGLAYSHLIGLSRQGVPRPQDARNPQSIEPSGALPRDGGESETLLYRLVQETIEICQRERWPVLALEVGIEGYRLAEIRNIFREHRITLLELPLHSARPELYYRIDRHWNVLGHQLVAERVLEYLDENGVPRP